MTFVIRPSDRQSDWRVAKNAMRSVCELVTEKDKPVRLTVEPYSKPKTDPQLRTLWMWHGEVASQLTERCKMSGHATEFDKDAVHELIFKPRFMPSAEYLMPDTGEVKIKPMGLSDKDATKPVVTDAMEAYLAWIYEQGMEVTIPEGGV